MQHGIYIAACAISTIAIKIDGCSVSRIRESTFGVPKAPDDDLPLCAKETTAYPTPGEIIGQIGLVVAICLGLGLLARVIVAFVGVQ